MIRLDGQRLGGDGEAELDNDEVRVAINPSILQLFFGTGYYFFDDVPIPHKAILGEERLLLPSQQESLLSRSKSQGDLFGHLWIRFCARLAEAQAESDKELQWIVCILYVFWLIIDGGLLFLLFRDDMVALLGISGCLLCVNLLPLSIPIGDIAKSVATFTYSLLGEEDRKVQQLVDEMALPFAKEGYHVDYVQDNRRWCPPLIYIRFTRRKNSSKKGSPLAETMLEYQRQAWREHQEALFTQRQREITKSDAFVSGIRIQTVSSYRHVIIKLPILFVFIYFVSCFFAIDGDDIEDIYYYFLSIAGRFS